MCRNIKKLRQPERAPTDEELRDAALQFVRKISGYREPSKANEKAFNKAVNGITRASRRMFDELVVGAAKSAPARTRSASR